MISMKEKIYMGLGGIFLAIVFSFLVTVPKAEASWTVVQNDPPTGGGSGVMWSSDTNFCLYNYESGAVYRAGASSNCLSYDWVGSASEDQTAIDNAYSADPTTLATASNALGYSFDWECDWSQFSDPCPEPPSEIIPTAGSSMWIIMQPLLLLAFVGSLFARAI